MDPASYPTPPPAPRCLPATPRWPRPPCHCQSRGSSLEAPFCGEEVSDLPLPSLAPWHPDGASQPPGQGPALLSPSSRAFGGPRLEARAGPPQVKGQRDLRVNRTQLSPALPTPPSSGGFWLKRDTGPHWPGSGVPAQSLGWLLDDALASSLAALAQPTCWTEPDQPGPTGPEDAGRSSTHHPRPRPSAPPPRLSLGRASRSPRIRLPAAVLGHWIGRSLLSCPFPSPLSKTLCSLLWLPPHLL